MKNVKIGAQVSAGFIVILVSMAALSAFSTVQINQINNNLSEVIKINSVKQRHAVNLRGSVNDRSIALRDLVLLTDKNEVEVALESISIMASDYERTLHEIDKLFSDPGDIDDEERQILQIINAMQLVTAPIIKQLTQHAIEEKTQDAKETLIESLRPLLTEWLFRINEFIDYQESKNWEIMARTRTISSQFHFIMIATTGVAILIGAVLVVWVMKAIRALGSLTNCILKIADGDLETEILHLDSKNEVGLIAGAVLVFQNNAHKVKKLQAQAAESEANARAKRIGEMNALADRFEASVTAAFDVVSRSVEEIRAAAEKFTSTAEQTMDRSQSVENAAASATQSTQIVVRAAEGLAASGKEISGRTTQSLQATRDAVHRTEAAGREIEQLSTAANHVGEIVFLIDNIASQTNLLALNATIEAARAGEAGKGFAVVANEVKSLAEQTANATRRITDQIATMQHAADIAVKAMNGVEETIRGIESAAVSIASAVDEQDSATSEIARSITEASSVADEILDHVHQVNMGAQATSQTAADVLSASESLGGQSRILRDRVREFLRTVRCPDN